MVPNQRGPQWSQSGGGLSCAKAAEGPAPMRRGPPWSQSDGGLSGPKAAEAPAPKQVRLSMCTPCRKGERHFQPPPTIPRGRRLHPSPPVRRRLLWGYNRPVGRGPPPLKDHRWIEPGSHCPKNANPSHTGGGGVFPLIQISMYPSREWHPSTAPWTTPSSPSPATLGGGGGLTILQFKRKINLLSPHPIHMTPSPLTPSQDLATLQGGGHPFIQVGT